MRAGRVAALADVHANAPALEAVLRDVVRESPDLVVFCGDLTWGSLPGETLALVRSLEVATRFVRGNADRAVLELSGGRRDATPRESWMLAQHRPEDVELLAAFEATVTVDVEGLGPTCFSHGSPRSDEECVTERTPSDRVRELMTGRSEQVVLTGHVHLQYEREVDGVRLVGPGSVGLPYHGEPGTAYWGLLGPGVELRSTGYDVEWAVRLMRESGDPSVEQIVELMLRPPSRDEVIEDAERRVFAG